MVEKYRYRYLEIDLNRYWYLPLPIPRISTDIYRYRYFVQSLLKATLLRSDISSDKNWHTLAFVVTQWSFLPQLHAVFETTKTWLIIYFVTLFIEQKMFDLINEYDISDEPDWFGTDSPVRPWRNLMAYRKLLQKCGYLSREGLLTSTTSSVILRWKERGVPTEGILRRGYKNRSFSLTVRQGWHKKPNPKNPTRKTKPINPQKIHCE